MASLVLSALGYTCGVSICYILVQVNMSAPNSSIKNNGEIKKDDIRLVKLAQNGDHDAYKQLFERYHKRAISLAVGVVRNPEEAKDIVQEAFIKAHRYLPKFEGTSSFYTWFYRIVMNLSIDTLRKKKRKIHVEFNDAFSQTSADTAGDHSLLPRVLGENPSRSLYRKELRQQIGLALEKLPEIHRTVLVMREIEGMSYDEMADVMECSTGTIMSRLFHARKKMQIALLQIMGGQR